MLTRSEVSLHGHSLLPLLRGDADRIRDYACTGHYRQTWSVPNHEWRFMTFLDGSRPDELYERLADPYDQRNVIAEHPDVARRLELELLRHVMWLSRH
jgi:hypothetical protein